MQHTVCVYCKWRALGPIVTTSLHPQSAEENMNAFLISHCSKAKRKAHYSQTKTIMVLLGHHSSGSRALEQRQLRWPSSVYAVRLFRLAAAFKSRRFGEFPFSVRMTSVPYFANSEVTSVEEPTSKVGAKKTEKRHIIQQRHVHCVARTTSSIRMTMQIEKKEEGARLHGNVHGSSQSVMVSLRPLGSGWLWPLTLFS